MGGLSNVAYSAFADVGDAPDEAAISTDNDVYIGGDLEVDGTIYASITATNVPWSGLTDPVANLTLEHTDTGTPFTTTFNWTDTTGDATLFSLNYDNNGGVAGTDYLLALKMPYPPTRPAIPIPKLFCFSIMPIRALPVQPWMRQFW